MARENGSLVNQLASKLPEGLLVDAAWLKVQGYSSQLQHQYVMSGWLEQPARSVFRRPRGTLSWQQAVISLQTILDYPPLVVGGRTALELQGYAHYLRHEIGAVHLHGPSAPPGWLGKLPLSVRFTYHNDRRLFPDLSASKKVPAATGAAPDSGTIEGFELARVTWGQWDWPLTVSTPERATFELLDEIPNHETFEQVDALFSSLSNLRPAHLQNLLAACGSVKVKRLFFYFADRHRHAWLKYLDKNAVDFGRGKRMLARGGILDRTYQITVPGEMNGVR